jgi:hypothetical protein
LASRTAKVSGCKSVDVNQTERERFIIQAFGSEFLQAINPFFEFVEEGFNHLLLG